MAFFDALTAVEKEVEEDVPNHLKDASRDSEGFGHGANYLYPHAFREHWVAQQYLPGSLQGRVFYQPADSGREKALADQVRRQRELQLAAMLESQSTPEILSFSPPDKARDQWLQRAAGQHGAQLETLRKRLIEALHIERHHLVLDLNSGTGLLAWEALRHAPEGGVWMHTPDKATAVALHEIAARLPELERPHMLHGSLTQLDELLDAEEESMRFDGICGRNALGSLDAKERIVARIVRRLLPGGHLALAEVLSRRAQRLHRLVNLDALDASLARRFVEAEEAIYEDEGNPHVAWDADGIRAHFAATGLASLEVHCEEVCGQRHISPQQLAHWFDPGGEKRHTYTHYLSKHLDEGDIRTVRHLFEKELAHKTLPWATSQVYITGRAP